MKSDEGESGKKQRPPSSSYSQQQGRSPRRQQQPQPPQLPPQQQQPQLGSSAAQQIAGYILPPQQQQQMIQYEQQQMQYAPNIGYLPPQPGQMYDQMYHPGLPPLGGPQHGIQQPSPQLYTAVGGVGGGSIMSSASSIPPGQMMPGYSPGMSSAQLAASQSQPMQHESFIQPRLGRLHTDRPIMKLTVGLIETYKKINQVRKNIKCSCLDCRTIWVPVMTSSNFSRRISFNIK